MKRRAIPNPKRKRPLALTGRPDARMRRGCDKAMRAAGDVATEASDKIQAIAEAHYKSCAVCKANAERSQIARLTAEANDQVFNGNI